mmetsp:Transcript_9535/g.27893  ORF Transcript_9535/g.27893 Transcript_9535/m.27893 type:complete len:208 (-) Transcript_9535:303-926(-)
MMRPAPPFCAVSTQRSMPWSNEARHEDWSEPKMSESPDSSCRRTVSGTLGSEMVETLPIMYTVRPLIGGRKSLMSGRVMSSGYMPPVCSWRLIRSSFSVQLKRSATPGRYHTGSTAALVTTTWPLSERTLPSCLRLPSLTACLISGMSRWDRVTAMVGRRSSSPDLSSAAKMPWAMWPHGSRETILLGSCHCLKGPFMKISPGSVLV